MGAQVAMGAQLAQQMSGAMGGAAAQPAQAAAARYACSSCTFASATEMKFCPQCGKPMRDTAAAPAGADNFCPKCRKMVSGKFCADCGTQTV